MIPLKERISLYDYAYLLQKFESFNAPRQFQRPIAWKSEDRKKFFQSMLMNRVEGTYVLVDVKSCIARLEMAGECDSETYKFFKKFLNEGYKYVILDGNNRMCFIKSLFDDEYAIPFIVIVFLVKLNTFYLMLVVVWLCCHLVGKVWVHNTELSVVVF